MALKVRFHTDNKELLARCLVFNARSIQIGKFPKGNFHVLPRLEFGNAATVHFPDLNFTPALWQEISTIKDYSLSQNMPAKTITKIVNLLGDYQAPDAGNIIAEWEKLEDKFWQLGTDFLNFDQIENQIESIDVLLTEFGSLGSFSATRFGDKYRVVCTTRVDHGSATLVNTLLQAFLLVWGQVRGDVGTVGWYQRGAILRFLVSETVWGRSMPRANLNKDVTPEIAAESKAYLTKLGYPPELTLDAAFAPSLTEYEKRLWELLVSSANIVVSFDQAANAIWKDEVDTKFSLYALAKLVEGLRAKIRAHGVNTSLIFTLRKQGYLLYQ